MRGGRQGGEGGQLDQHITIRRVLSWASPPLNVSERARLDTCPSEACCAALSFALPCTSAQSTPQTHQEVVVVPILLKQLGVRHAGGQDEVARQHALQLHTARRWQRGQGGQLISGRAVHSSTARSSGPNKPTLLRSKLLTAHFLPRSDQPPLEPQLACVMPTYTNSSAVSRRPASSTALLPRPGSRRRLSPDSSSPA